MSDYERGARDMREACAEAVEGIDIGPSATYGRAGGGIVRAAAARVIRSLPLPTPPAREPRPEPIPCNAHLDAEVVPGPYCPVCSYLDARKDGVDATLDAMRKRDAMKARGPEAGLVAALGNALGRHYQMTHREVVDRAARAVLKYQAEQVPARDPDEGRVEVQVQARSEEYRRGFSEGMEMLQRSVRKTIAALVERAESAERRALRTTDPTPIPTPSAADAGRVLTPEQFAFYEAALGYAAVTPGGPRQWEFRQRVPAWRKAREAHDAMLAAERAGEEG